VGEGEYLERQVAICLRYCHFVLNYVNVNKAHPFNGSIPAVVIFLDAVIGSVSTVYQLPAFNTEINSLVM
jgi:hypothetical protein